jgi:hypothetical protein
MIKHGQIFGLSSLVLLGFFDVASLAQERRSDVEPSPRLIWENDWTVVTIAQDKSWGIGTAASQGLAIATAIKHCKTMSAGQSDCGAQFTTIRVGWTIANLCGDHKVIVTGISLADAEKAALGREIELQLFYVPDLPPCKRIITVDPTGAIVAQKPQFSSAR